MTLTEITTIAAALVHWYRQAKRDLPWRHTRDPYAIWVSEIMLQQTQVDTVIPRYGQFLNAFPTVQALAAVSESAVCEAWAGLGYYRRARHLHAGAREVVNKLEGVIPRSAKALQQLPGIGRYTAGAIASIAFGEREPLVDGNVERVLARVFAMTDKPKSKEGQAQLWAWAEALVRNDVVDVPGDLNQALMELGATVCTPREPKCGTCPLRSVCVAAEAGDVMRYPVMEERKKPTPLDVAFAWIKTHEGVLLRQRSLDGLWAGLWELPSAEGDDATVRLAQQLGVTLGPEIATITHQLTHRTVTARVYHIQDGDWMRTHGASMGWKLCTDPLEEPLSVLARKAIVAASGALSR